MIVLLDGSTNNHGRWLVQHGSIIRILAGCCEAPIDAQVDDKLSGRTWAKCSACENFLQINEEGWASELVDIEYFEKTRPASWGRWAEFWFGLKDFEMKVTTT